MTKINFLLDVQEANTALKMSYWWTEVYLDIQEVLDLLWGDSCPCFGSGCCRD